MCVCVRVFSPHTLAAGIDGRLAAELRTAERVGGVEPDVMLTESGRGARLDGSRTEGGTRGPDVFPR